MIKPNTICHMARVVNISTITISNEHIDGAITAILSSILFVRYQNKVTSERRRLKSLNLSYAAIVDNNDTTKEIEYIIKKFRARFIDKGLPGIIRLRFLERLDERGPLSPLELLTETHGAVSNGGANLEIEVWNIFIDVINEEQLQECSEATIRAALKEVYDACLVCDHISVPCVFTLSVVRKTRSGSESDSTSEGSVGQKKRRNERHCRSRSSSVSSANGRSLLFKIFDSAGIL